MIVTTFNLMKINKMKSLDDKSVFDSVITPLQRVEDFSDEAFEEFIANGQWLMLKLNIKTYIGLVAREIKVGM